MQPKTILITGCSTGIGHDAVVALSLHLVGKEKMLND